MKVAMNSRRADHSSSAARRNPYSRACDRFLGVILAGIAVLSAALMAAVLSS